MQGWGSWYRLVKQFMSKGQRLFRNLNQKSIFPPGHLTIIPPPHAWFYWFISGTLRLSFTLICRSKTKCTYKVHIHPSWGGGDKRQVPTPVACFKVPRMTYKRLKLLTYYHDVNPIVLVLLVFIDNSKID